MIEHKVWTPPPFLCGHVRLFYTLPYVLTCTGVGDTPEAVLEPVVQCAGHPQLPLQSFQPRPQQQQHQPGHSLHRYGLKYNLVLTHKIISKGAISNEHN